MYPFFMGLSIREPSPDCRPLIDNSELRVLFKENVQYACNQIAEILRRNMQ